MAEPVSSGAGGALAWKLAGGAVGIVAGVVVTASVLSAIVVMSITLPKTKREWAVGLISTVMSGLALGSYVVSNYGMAEGIEQALMSRDALFMQLHMAMLGGVVFVSGLPGWFLVRAAFRWMEKRDTKDLGELMGEAGQTP